VTLDATIFLYIGISGFMTVYSYRLFVKSDKKLSEFEWLGLSAFWGLIIITFLSLFSKIFPNFTELISNPFATALVDSIFGIGFSFSGSQIVKFYKEIKECNKKK